MDTQRIMSHLNQGFAGHVSLRTKRHDIQKLLVPLFHEDGDMVDIFLEIPNNTSDDIIRVSDHGLTSMRLSYDYEMNTPNKEKIFRQILSESKLSEDHGNLFLDTKVDDIYPAILHFGQVISRICSMRLYKREVMGNLFYEMVDEFVTTQLAKLKPEANSTPLPNRAELIVDYSFLYGNNPVYLFAEKEGDSSKARLTAISCLEFGKNNLPFRSAVIHQNFDSLSKKDRNIITSAVDKQFTSFDDFKKHGEQAITRLAA